SILSTMDSPKIGRKKCHCQSGREPPGAPKSVVFVPKPRKNRDRPSVPDVSSIPDYPPVPARSYLLEQRPSTSDGRGGKMEVEVKVEMSWNSDAQFKTFEEKCAAFASTKRDIFAPIANHTRVIREYESGEREWPRAADGAELRIGAGATEQQKAAFAAFQRNTPNFVPIVNHVMGEVTSMLSKMNIEAVEPVAASVEKREERGAAEKQKSPVDKKVEKGRAEKKDEEEEEENKTKPFVVKGVCEWCKLPANDDARLRRASGGWVHHQCAIKNNLPLGCLSDPNFPVYGVPHHLAESFGLNSNKTKNGKK
ncbi:hypothetical protein PFISCL1PPCAC_23042, partial [Pristionchus fissidentatus]